MFNHVDTTVFTNLMIVGGQGSGGDVEIIDLSGDRKNCNKPSDHNYEWGATGLYFDGFATVCGGYSGTSNCYRYDINSNSWNGGLTMNVARVDHASSFISNNEWWISGGTSSPSQSSTEILSAGESVFKTSVTLPESMSDHTMVRVNNSYVIFVGNWAGSGTNRVYEFKTSCQCFDSLPSQSVTRKGPAAGLIKRPNGSLQMVVAGGLSSNSIDLSSSEIYDINSQTWSTGPNLPSAWYLSTSVPFGDTFLVVGGVSSGSRSDDIYEFDPVANTWKTRIEKMSLDRYDHAAFLVPDEIARCN